MAYRFNGSSDYVRFAPTPLNGHSGGALTMACFVKRSAAGGAVQDTLIGLINSGLTSWRAEFLVNGDQLEMITVLSASHPGVARVTGTTVWYLCVVTWAGAGTTPRFHLNDGSSWVHENGNATLASGGTVGGTDVFTVSNSFSSGLALAGDVVCAGVKMASSSDGAVETLSRTLFSAWQAFSFDWLIGFDSSLESAGILQDQASPGTGDESAISGTSQVSDPPGWAWVDPVATFVPQIVIL